TSLHLVNLGRKLGIFRAIGGKQFAPTGAHLGAVGADAGGEVGTHRIGHQELGVLRPSVIALGETHLLLAQRLAVRGGGVLLVRRAVTDMAGQNGEGRGTLGPVKDVERLLDPLDVIGVADAQNIPPVAEEAGGDVLGEGDARVAFDGDVVVVVDPAEVIEGEVAGQRGRFRTHTLHHAAVAANRVDVVVEDVEAGAIVAVGEPGLGYGHAHASGDALAERTGRRLDSGNQVVFG